MLFFDLPDGRQAPPAAKPDQLTLLAIEPDYEDTTLLALQNGVEEPDTTDTFDDTDADTAAYIAEHLPPDTPDRHTRLEALRAEIFAEAITASRKALVLLADLRSAEAEALRLKADASRSDAARDAEATVREASRLAAEAAVEAVEASARARGAARAIDLALKGIEWTPRDLQADADDVFGLGLGPDPDANPA